MDRQLSPLLVQMVDRMEAAVLVTGTDLEPPGPTIVYANRAFCRQSGYEVDELLGRNPRLFQGERTVPDVLKKLRRALEAGEDFAGETWNYRKDGSEYRVRWYIQQLYDEDGTVSHLFATQEDLSGRVALLRDMLGLARASFEGLSLAGFVQLLEMEGKTCRVRVRHGSDSGLLFFDEGRLVDAATGARKGRAAALEVLSWRRAQVDLEPLVEAPPAAFDDPLEALLLEAASPPAATNPTDPLLRSRRPTVTGSPAAPEPAKGGAADLLTALEQTISAERLDRAFAVARRTGAHGMALLDSNHGVALASSGSVDAPELERLAAANSHFVRYKNRVLAVLGLQDELEDIVVTHERQWHVLRPIRGAAGLCLFALYDRDGHTLAAVREGVARAEGELNSPTQPPTPSSAS